MRIDLACIYIKLDQDNIEDVTVGYSIAASFYIERFGAKPRSAAVLGAFGRGSPLNAAMINAADSL
jgi:hypothetical protein